MAPITECLHSYRAHDTLATLPGRSLQEPETTSLTIKMHNPKGEGAEKKEQPSWGPELKDCSMGKPQYFNIANKLSHFSGKLSKTFKIWRVW